MHSVPISLPSDVMLLRSRGHPSSLRSRLFLLLINASLARLPHCAGNRALLEVCSFTTSLGEIDTLIIHPASTSHVSLAPEEREALGITDDLVRLSVGIEDVNDIRHDLEQALEKI